MKPAPFVHHRPTSLEEALGLLEEHGEEAKVLAGGQSLVPVLNMRLAGPAHLVDINRVPDLDRVGVADGQVRVGALVRHARLLAHDGACEASPLLRQTLPWVAHPAIRNRGTTVGSIVHADPSGEMPAVLALTGGHVVLRSADGERTVPAAEFFVAPMESVVEAGEVAIEAVFPVQPEGTSTAFTELARRHGDYALAGVAVSVQRAEAGDIEGAKASFVSLTPTPDVLDLTDALRGCEEDLQPFADAVITAVAEHVDPHDDIHGSADYRRHLAGVLTLRLLAQLTNDRKVTP